MSTFQTPMSNFYTSIFDEGVERVERVGEVFDVVFLYLRRLDEVGEGEGMIMIKAMNTSSIDNVNKFTKMTNTLDIGVGCKLQMSGWILLYILKIVLNKIKVKEILSVLSHIIYNNLRIQPQLRTEVNIDDFMSELATLEAKGTTLTTRDTIITQSYFTVDSINNEFVSHKREITKNTNEIIVWNLDALEISLRTYLAGYHKL